MMEFLVYLHDSGNVRTLANDIVTGIIVADSRFSAAVGDEISEEDISRIHKAGFKALVKADRLYEEDELEALQQFLEKLGQWGTDGIIYTDLAIKVLLERMHLDIEGIYAPETLLTNYYDIRTLKDDGAGSCVISKDIPLRDVYAIVSHVPDYCMVRIHGPILIACSRRRYISAYLQSDAEYTRDYYLQEETREEKLRTVEKSSGNWLYGPCLQSFSEIGYIYGQPFRGVIMDNVYLDDEYTLKAVQLYQKMLRENGDPVATLDSLKQVNNDVSYVDINELKETWLEKE